jgi:hypothetical protein
MSSTSGAFNQTERDYNIIRDALSAKPDILKTILRGSQRQADEYTAATLIKDELIKPDIPKRLAHAEKHYQTTLSKQAEYLLALYKNQPIDRKVELLIYAEEIGEINEKARKLASEQMQSARAEAIMAHRAEIAHPQVLAKDTLHVFTPKTSKTSKPWKLAPQTDDNAEITKHIMQVPAYGLPYLLTDKYPSQNKTPPIQTPQEKGLINLIGLGNPAAVTVNLPFIAIPGLPALSKMLEKIDKTTHFDLGFTIKGVADRAPNPDGGYDLLYRVSYAGAVIMSSNANLQFTPMALKVQESVDKDKWGGNSSIFTRHKTDNLGDKFSVNFNDSDGSINYAHEYSIQKPSTRLISTLTAGHHFSRESSPAFRIPAEFVPTLTRIVAALPDKEEAGIIFDRIDKVIPVNQVIEVALSVASYVVDKIDTLKHSEPSSLATAKHLLQQQIVDSGLTAKEQAYVLARVCENCENSAEQILPSLYIKEKVLVQKNADAEQR